MESIPFLQELWAWIKTHYQWLFSGAGVVALGFISRLLWKKRSAKGQIYVAGNVEQINSTQRQININNSKIGHVGDDVSVKEINMN